MTNLINSYGPIDDIKSIGDFQYSHLYLRNNNFLTTTQKNPVIKVRKQLCFW